MNAKDTTPPSSAPPSAARSHASLGTLLLGALGVVFGDIGTSPLYTLRECLHAAGGHHAGRLEIFGILSLIFWALTMVVTVKYLAFVMQADNHGEGGIFALLAIVPHRLRPDCPPMDAPSVRLDRPRSAPVMWVSLLVVIGAALLYGDGAITPAISVLSAIEGLKLVQPGLGHLVVPITCAILLGLFTLQSRGTGMVGKLFGPVMVLWFLTIGALGAWHIAHRPEVLGALSPHHAVRFFAAHGLPGAVVLGSVVLAVTGGEALYADMGHFGRPAIRWSWFVVVMPALVLSYLGQGALLLQHPEALANPFFAMVPPGAATLALVVLSSLATVIASQALISGAFSLTRQAMQLGYFPRVTITHTASQTEGQIYIPQINWLLAAACLLLVVSFKRSTHLASAYGLAVTGTMAITSIVYYVVVREAWGWSRARALPLLVLFLSFDLPFFAANTLKLVDGGWVPVLIGSGFVAAMLIWSRGRTLMVAKYARRFGEMTDVLPALHDKLKVRIPGSAVFMASSTTHAPPILMHFVERNHVLPETVILLTIRTGNTPDLGDRDRCEFTPLGEGFYRLVVHYGFMEHPHVPSTLADAVRRHGLTIDLDETTYYLGRESVLASQRGRMGRIAESLFAFLSRNAVAADRHFGIPPRQVMEIGMQIDL